MRRLGLLLQKNWVISAVFLALAVAYVFETLTSTVSPATEAKYHASASQIHHLGLAIALPYIVIWVVGLIGYLWLRSYTSYLGESKDAAGFRIITRAVLLFTFWLPFSTLAANLASSYYAIHPDSTALLVRLVNYLNIIILLPAFWWVYQGANRLLSSAKITSTGLSIRQTICYIVFAAIYVFLTFHDPARQNSTDDVLKATYYLNDWWLLFTLVIPRLIMWYIGFAAAASIILYRQKVKGSLYKEALRWVAFGLTGIVISTIVLRTIQSLSTQLSKLSLLVLFLVIYVLLALIATGYVLLAKGASRLQKIEEL
jgi:uncharacterized membrane protein